MSTDEKVQKLSLTSMILISTNIMLGSGIFINTSILTSRAGSLCFLSYIILGVLLLPLVLAIIQLWQNTTGACTFYHFGLPVSPFFGFLSSWSYFIAKTGSFALGIHVCVSLLQQIIPILSSINTILLDSIIIFLFTYANSLNLKTGQAIQSSFLILKLIPILFTIFTGLYLFTGSHFSSDTFIWTGLPGTIPLVLYAFAGFEASCSLSQSLDNPKKNGPKAIIISYFIVLTIAILFQLIFFGNLGMILGKLPQGYLDAFPALLNKLFASSVNIKKLLISILYIGIASSSLGASYGIMFSNSWNLYTLAQYKHIFKFKFFSSLNKHKIPYICVISQGLIGIFYLLITQGQQIPLQQLGSLGPTIAYTFSIISLVIINYKNKKVQYLPILAMCSCLLLIGSFIWSIFSYGIQPLLIIFMILTTFGTFMFYKKHETPATDIYENL